MRDNIHNVLKAPINCYAKDKCSNRKISYRQKSEVEMSSQQGTNLRNLSSFSNQIIIFYYIKWQINPFNKYVKGQACVT